MKYQFKAKIQLGPHVVTLNEIALYSDGDIGVSSEYLESKLPPDHFIDWDRECISYDDEQGQIFKNIFPIMSMEEWVQIDGDKVQLFQNTGLKDSKGADIYIGDHVKWNDSITLKKFRHAKVIDLGGQIGFEILPDSPTANEGYVFKFGTFAYQDTSRHLEIIKAIYPVMK